MEIYRELYQISKSLSEFTNKARRLHKLMNEPMKLEPNQTVKFNQPEWWEPEFDNRFQLALGNRQQYDGITIKEEIKQFIRDLLKEQRLEDSIEPEEL